ncbi:hypothetical protein [Actinokineospora terrae]|uniref:Uncharacterized protein n=1 Tax=Actinokineospora terrae TaxID=155974 RepID=A0A1H9L7D4_9PSEU|nr:hypothetical protein [Actinokineospora terrae]SER07421.1 hypothetical protein SAMN04487818_101493 [Actinokineospora terrae]
MSPKGRLAALVVGIGLAAGIGIAAPALAAPNTPLAAPAGVTSTTYTYGFEGGDWEGWSPEDGGNTRGWWIDHTTARAHGGSQSLNYQLDGTWDNGTIWIEKAFTTTASTALPVTVTYWGWSPASGGPGSGYWLTTASIKGTDHTLGATASNPPWDNLGTWDITPEQYYGGWHQYTKSATVNTVASGNTVYVAIALHANFETTRDYLHFDDVSVTIG